MRTPSCRCSFRVMSLQLVVDSLDFLALCPSCHIVRMFFNFLLAQATQEQSVQIVSEQLNELHKCTSMQKPFRTRRVQPTGQQNTLRLQKRHLFASSICNLFAPFSSLNFVYVKMLSSPDIRPRCRGGFFPFNTVHSS